MGKKDLASRSTPPGDYQRRWVRVPRRKLTPAMEQRLIQGRERQTQALELRKAGVSYQKIADSVGYKTADAARKAVRAAIDRLAIEPAMEVVQISLATLDELQMRVMAAFRAGDLSQADRILRIMGERHALLGVTSETFKEEAAKKAGVSLTQNAIMIVQGSESDFVAQMMRAVGMNVADPTNAQYLARLQQQEQKYDPETTHGSNTISGEVVHSETAPTPTPPTTTTANEVVLSAPVHRTVEEAMAAQKNPFQEMKKAILAGHVRDDVHNVESVPEIPAIYEGSVDEDL